MLANFVTTRSWSLISQNGAARPVTMTPLSRLPCSVGRRTTADFFIPNPDVSGSHAQLFEQDGELFVRDLGSTNGTFVNGERIQSETRLTDGDLIQFALALFRVQEEQTGTQLATSNSSQESVLNFAASLASFDKLISDDALIPYYQAIVEIRSKRVIGYEVLGRSRLFGLQRPDAMFRVAAQLNQESALSEFARHKGVTVTPEEKPPHLFLNTHPVELQNADSLIASLRALRHARPCQPLTLEIHEQAITDLASIKKMRLALSDLQIGMAYDDFGAGQSRLIELAETRPNCVKFDRAMIQNLDQAPATRLKLIESLVNIVVETGAVPLAEGVETVEEEAVCRQLGFELVQGYLYGRPASASKHFKSQKQRQDSL